MFHLRMLDFSGRRDFFWEHLGYLAHCLWQEMFGGYVEGVVLRVGSQSEIGSGWYNEWIQEILLEGDNWSIYRLWIVTSNTGYPFPAVEVGQKIRVYFESSALDCRGVPGMYIDQLLKVQP